MTRRRSRLGQVLSAGAAVLLLVILLGPFFQVVYGALFPQAAGFSLEPVYQVFLATPEYLLVFWRTLALCALIVAGQTVLSVLAGLGFAKDHFPGKGLCFFLLLVVMVLPLQVTLVPNFRILGTLGLLDTQWALVLPALFAPLGTFLMTQSFRAVPDEILEAAQLDGANMVQALGKILVPMSKNGLACVVVLTFLETWNMVEQPMAYLKDTSQHPLSVALATTQARDVGVQLACCLLALLPPLLLFLGLRKELLEGIALQENWTGERAHRGFCRALAVALVVLVECTVLSGFISREMAIQVEGVPPQTDRAAGTNSLPLDAFHQEEDGTFLYLLEESAGLTQGMELRRVPADILGMEGDRAFTTGLEDRGTYALYGSRPLEDEARAVELAAQDPAPDTYLLWAPAGVELSLNAASAPVDGGTVYLLPQEEAAQPGPGRGSGPVPAVQLPGNPAVCPGPALGGFGSYLDGRPVGVLRGAVSLPGKKKDRPPAAVGRVDGGQPGGAGSGFGKAGAAPLAAAGGNPPGPEQLGFHLFPSGEKPGSVPGSRRGAGRGAGAGAFRFWKHCRLGSGGPGRGAGREAVPPAQEGPAAEGAAF